MGRRNDAWDQYGKLETVEPAGWDDTLPRNFRGNVELDLNGAIKLGRLNFANTNSNWRRSIYQR